MSITIPQLSKETYHATRQILKTSYLEAAAKCKVNNLALRKPHADYTYQALYSLQVDKRLDRHIARHLHIAYAMFKGNEYAKIESPKTKEAPDWKFVQHTINQAIGQTEKQHVVA